MIVGRSALIGRDEDKVSRHGQALGHEARIESRHPDAADDCIRVRNPAEFAGLQPRRGPEDGRRLARGGDRRSHPEENRPQQSSPHFSPGSWSARCCRAAREGKTRSASRVGARCGTSGKRLDAPCRSDSAALRVAPRRPPAAAPTPPSIQAAALRAASRASTVGTATLFGPLLADRTPGRDTGRDPGEKCGLAGAVRARPVPCSSGRHPRGLRTRCRASCGYAGPARPAPGCASGGR